MDKNINEAITNEADLLLKLRPLPEMDIFEFMKNLRGGTYFNMGMYSAIPVSRAYKATIRIYKVVDLAAVVSGVSYENIGTTKDFRNQTGEGPSKSWYDHMQGFENKIGVKKSDPNAKYILWDIKAGTNTCVRYYVVDIANGNVTPVTKADVLNSDYLTDSEKKKLTPHAVTGFDLNTGSMVENKTVWRTASFDHVFWLSQNGKDTKEYGTRFAEALAIEEALNESEDLIRDGNINAEVKLDDILSGKLDADYTEELSVNTPAEDLDEEVIIEDGSDIFIDGNNAEDCQDLDAVLAGDTEIDEQYSPLVNNELFVDFD